MSEENKIYLSFRLANQWYCIDVKWIVEVLWLVYLDEIPSDNPDVLGVLNLHGNTMPVIDLRKRLALPEAELTLYTPIITSRISDTPIAFLVDEVSDIVTINTTQLTKTSVSPYVQYTFHIDSNLIRILDAEAISATLIKSEQ